MDQMWKPLHSGPMFPVGSRWQQHSGPRRLQGTIVGIRSGRSHEAGMTRILTIKLSEPHPETGKLLHADVDLLVRPKS